MATGGNLHANRTSVRLKEFITALWGLRAPKGRPAFGGPSQNRPLADGYTAQSIQWVKRFTQSLSGRQCCRRRHEGVYQLVWRAKPKDSRNP
jgi:hypothetical protein